MFLVDLSKKMLTTFAIEQLKPCFWVHQILVNLKLQNEFGKNSGLYGVRLIILLDNSPKNNLEIDYNLTD